MLDPTHRVAGDLKPPRPASSRSAAYASETCSAVSAACSEAAPADAAAAGLTPLPPASLRDGRVYLGPFRLPLQPLPPLY